MNDLSILVLEGPSESGFEILPVADNTLILRVDAPLDEFNAEGLIEQLVEHKSVYADRVYIVKIDDEITIIPPDPIRDNTDRIEAIERRFEEIALLI